MGEKILFCMNFMAPASRSWDGYHIRLMVWKMDPIVKKIFSDRKISLALGSYYQCVVKAFLSTV